jgi:dihydropteroate synthase
MGVLNVTPDSFSDGGRYAGMGGADSDAQAGTFENFELDAAESTGEIAADSRRAEEIKSEAVVGVGVNGGSERF